MSVKEKNLTCVEPLILPSPGPYSAFPQPAAVRPYRRAKQEKLGGLGCLLFQIRMLVFNRLKQFGCVCPDPWVLLLALAGLKRPNSCQLETILMTRSFYRPMATGLACWAHL